MSEGNKYDIGIIGGGPAGLSAAVNAAIRKKRIILFCGDFDHTKMTRAPKIDNYLGIPGVTGLELRQRFLDHFKEFSVDVVYKKVQNVFPGDDNFQLLVKDTFYETKAVILATGVAVNRTMEGENELVGRGVGYCATCDGPLYRDKTIVLIDHTKEGIDEAVFLSEFCKRVYYLCMHNNPPTFEQPNIEVVVKEKPVKILGDGAVTGLQTDKRVIETDGIFIFRETFPPQELVPGLEIAGNEILVNRHLETNIKGLYAAGDCTGKPYQMAKASGEGQAAALNAVAYLDDLKTEK